MQRLTRGSDLSDGKYFCNALGRDPEVLGELEKIFGEIAYLNRADILYRNEYENFLNNTYVEIPQEDILRNRIKNISCERDFRIFLLCGGGGIGKTTFLTKLWNDKRKEGIDADFWPILAQLIETPSTYVPEDVANNIGEFAQLVGNSTQDIDVLLKNTKVVNKIKELFQLIKIPTQYINVSQNAVNKINELVAVGLYDYFEKLSDITKNDINEFLGKREIPKVSFQSLISNAASRAELSHYFIETLKKPLIIFVDQCDQRSIDSQIQIAQCLTDIQSDYGCPILVSVRPTTFTRMLNECPTPFFTIGISQKIDITEPAPLGSILKKRLDYFFSQPELKLPFKDADIQAAQSRYPTKITSAIAQNIANNIYEALRDKRIRNSIRCTFYNFLDCISYLSGEGNLTGALELLPHIFASGHLSDSSLFDTLYDEKNTLRDTWLFQAMLYGTMEWYGEGVKYQGKCGMTNLFDSYFDEDYINENWYLYLWIRFLCLVIPFEKQQQDENFTYGHLIDKLEDIYSDNDLKNTLAILYRRGLLTFDIATLIRSDEASGATFRSIYITPDTRIVVTKSGKLHLEHFIYELSYLEMAAAATRRPNGGLPPKDSFRREQYMFNFLNDLNDSLKFISKKGNVNTILNKYFMTIKNIINKNWKELDSKEKNIEQYSKKLFYLENELSICSDPTKKYELTVRIRECQEQIERLEQYKRKE